MSHQYIGIFINLTNNWFSININSFLSECVFRRETKINVNRHTGAEGGALDVSEPCNYTNDFLDLLNSHWG